MNDKDRPMPPLIAFAGALGGLAVVRWAYRTALRVNKELEEGRLAALEAFVTVRLESGGHADLVGELQTLTTAHPLREKFWAQRMLALYRCGRQADALRVYRKLHATLDEELGIQPSGELRDLEARILRQDPSLVGSPPADAERRVDPPETRYVASDGVHIAYQVIGDGEMDIVAVPGLISHLDLWWEDRLAAVRAVRKGGHP